MAVLSTQAEVDALRNKYFVLEDGTDWPTNTLSTALAQGYKARIASLAQGLQDDLVDLLDTADSFI